MSRIGYHFADRKTSHGYKMVYEKRDCQSDRVGMCPSGTPRISPNSPDVRCRWKLTCSSRKGRRLLTPTGRHVCGAAEAMLPSTQGRIPNVEGDPVSGCGALA